MFSGVVFASDGDDVVDFNSLLSDSVPTKEFVHHLKTLGFGKQCDELISKRNAALERAVQLILHPVKGYDNNPMGTAFTLYTNAYLNLKVELTKQSSDNVSKLVDVLEIDYASIRYAIVRRDTEEIERIKGSKKDKSS